MLSTLLTSVQSALTAYKGYLIAAFLPVLLTSLASAWMYSRLPGGSLEPWTTWISQNPGFTGVLAGLAIGFAALGFAALGPLMLRVLEGRALGFWPWLRSEMMARQMKGQNDAEQKFRALDRAFWALKGATWKDQLREARRLPGKTAPPPHAPAGVAQAIAELQAKVDGYQEVPLGQVESAFTKLRDQLRLYAPGPGDWLDQIHVQFNSLLPFVETRIQRDRLDAYWRFKAYSEMPEPTRLGSIGATMRSYAESRYEISLDILWPRLQRVIQSDTALFSTLQDAKVQLDLFVSCTWLAALFGLGWSLTLLFSGTDWWSFLVAWLIAPLISAGCYRLACVSYQAFAEVVSAAIDLQRFKLLDSLHLAAPVGLDEERDLWKRVGEFIGYQPKGGAFFYKK